MRNDLSGYVSLITMLVMAAACGTSHSSTSDAGLDTSGDAEPPYYEPPDTPLPETQAPLELQAPELCEDAGRFGVRWNPLPLFADQGFDYSTVTLGTVVFEAGVPCSGATDVPACESAFDALLEDRPRVPGLIVTAVDDVRFISDPSELVEMFGGGIATPEQALVMAWLDGYFPTCEGPRASGAEESGDGFRVTMRIVEQVAPCRDGDVQVVLRVDAETGTVTELERRIIAIQTPVCI